MMVSLPRVWGLTPLRRTPNGTLASYFIATVRTAQVEKTSHRAGKSNYGMYDSLTDFMKSFSADHSVLWALLVMAVVAFTGLALFAFWELVLRYPLNKEFLKKIVRRSTE